MHYVIRNIEKKDDKFVEKIIRDCLIEFGGNRKGLAWEDPFLGRLSEVYTDYKEAYWVAEDESGEVVGGVGIGGLPHEEDVCELQKMYCATKARGTGAADALIEVALNFAKKHYKKCYLETLFSMKRAQKFYLKHGFIAIEKPLGDTGHYSCEAWYIKDL